MSDKQQSPDSTRFYPGGGIIQNKYSMWMGMLSDYGGISWPMKWQMRWGVVPLPRDRAATTLAIVDGFFISAKTQHPEECWKWVMFLSEQVPTLNMPTRKALAESNDYAQLVGNEVAEASRAAVVDAVLINPNLMGFEQALGALDTAFSAIRDGQTTAEAALDTAQEQADF